MIKTQIDMIVNMLPLQQKIRKQAGYQFRCPICFDSKKKATLKREITYWFEVRKVI